MTSARPDDAWLPRPVDIPGLTFRPYAGDADVPAMVGLRQMVNKAFGVPEILSVEQELHVLRNQTHVDPGLDFINAYIDDRLVATSSIEWADTTEGERHYFSRGWVHPDQLRRGIGTAMLTRNEARLRQIAESHRHDRSPLLVTWIEEADVGGRALFESHGYEQVRIYRHMVRPDMDEIDVGVLPDGIEIRPISHGSLPRLWDAMMEAFRDHFGAEDDSPAAYRRWAEDPSLDLDLFAVAFDGDEIAAGVLGYIEAEENDLFGYRRGWADPVFTRRPWRRQGLAHALVGRCLLRLREHGMTSAQLDVDTENPNDASTLYQRHRFELERASTEWHRRLSV